MTTRTSGESVRERDTIEFRLLIALMFMIFLVGVAAWRLMPWHWQADRVTAVPRISIIGEAKAAANAIVPYAFMG